MTDRNINNLLEQLSDSMKALQGSYSEFAQKCEEPEKQSFNKFSDVIKGFEHLKLDLNKSISVIRESTEGLAKSIRKFKEFGQFKGFESVIRELDQAYTAFRIAEQGIHAFNEELDYVSRLVKDNHQESVSFVQELERKLQTHSRRNLSLSSWEDFPVPPNFAKTQKIFVDYECENIVEKMNCVTDRIHFQAVNSKGSDKKLERNELTSSKIVNFLEMEIQKLRKKVWELEEREIESIECRAQLDSAQLEISEMMNKTEEVERCLVEKDFKIKQLVRTVEESRFERKKTFESFFKLREELEAKVAEQEALLRQLRDDKDTQEHKVELLNSQLMSLRKSKKDLTIENNELKNNLEIALRMVKENDMKLKQSSSQLEKKSELEEKLAKVQNDKLELETELVKTQEQVKSQSENCEALQKTLKTSEKHLSEAKFNLNKLFSEYEELKIASKSLETSKKLLEESQTATIDYQSQVISLKSSLSVLEQDFLAIKKKCDEQENTIKDLQIKLAFRPERPLPNLSQLQKSNESLIKDNESLIEAQAFTTDYLKAMKNSYKTTIDDMKVKLESSNKKISELSEALNCQQYLYNKLEKEIKETPSPIKFSRSIHRKHTSSDLDHNTLKSVETLKKLFATQTFDINLIAMIGVELDEDNPQNFYSKILDLKKERDSYYMSTQKLEDLIDELKSELNEQDEYQLLSHVLKLKKTNSKL